MSAHKRDDAMRVIPLGELLCRGFRAMVRPHRAFREIRDTEQVPFVPLLLLTAVWGLGHGLLHFYALEYNWLWRRAQGLTIGLGFLLVGPGCWLLGTFGLWGVARLLKRRVSLTACEVASFSLWMVWALMPVIDLLHHVGAPKHDFLVHVGPLALSFLGHAAWFFAFPMILCLLYFILRDVVGLSGWSWWARCGLAVGLMVVARGGLESLPYVVIWVTGRFGVRLTSSWSIMLVLALIVVPMLLAWRVRLWQRVQSHWLPVVVVLFLGIIGWPKAAWAVTKTWDGGDASYNTASSCANWNNDTCPAAGDAIVFNATSSKDCTWDILSGSDVASFTVGQAASAYTGTVTLSNALSMTGNLAVRGTLSLNGQNVTVKGGGLTGAGTIYCGNGNNTCSAGTVLVDTTGSLGGGTYTFYNLTLGDGVGATTTTAAGNFTVSNVLTIAANQTFNGGASNAVIYLSGSGTPFVINGTFTANTSTVVYNSSSGATVTSTTYNGLQINANATFNLGGSITVSGTLLKVVGVGLGGTAILNTNQNTYIISASNANIQLGSASGFAIYGKLITNASTVTAKVLTLDGGTVESVINGITTGGLNIVGGSTWTVTTGWLTLNGTKDASPACGETGVWCDSQGLDIKNVTLSGGASISAQTDLKAAVVDIPSAQTLDISGRTLTLTGDDSSVTGKTPLTLAGTLTENSSSTIEFAATSGTTTVNARTYGGSLKINGSGGTFNAGGAVTINGTFTLADGIYNTGNNTHTFGDAAGDTVTISGGNLHLQVTNTTTQIVKTAGTWTNSGTSTITYDAGSAVTTSLLSALSAYNNLTINSSGSTYTANDNITASGTLTVQGGTCAVGTTTMTAANVTVSGGTLSMLGSGGILKIGNNGTLSMTSGTFQVDDTATTPSLTTSGTVGTNFFGVSFTGGTVDVDALAVDSLKTSGFVIGSSVTITNFNKVRWGASNGVWSGQSGTEVLLDITRSSGTVNLRSHTFPSTWSSFGSGDCNVRDNTAGTIVIWDWTGGYGGENNDCDTSGGEVVWKGGSSGAPGSGTSTYPAIY